MNRTEKNIIITVGVVIIALTAVAFWLSFAHLHTVAAQHGLGASVARAWAWPATLDLFIIAGELLMLRASLRHEVDWWAIVLTVVGSGGSIALNVFGVGGRDPLAYVIAAVPPTAALLAFGALMRQAHTVLKQTASVAVAPEPVASPAATRPTRASVPAASPASPPASASVERVPAPASPTVPVPASPAATPAASAPATPAPTASPAASASDTGASRDLAEVAAVYRALRTSTGKHRPSSAALGQALGVSRSRGQQLRDALETHPDYAGEFAPALKSA